MNRKVSLILWIAAVAALLSISAVAQSGAIGDSRQVPQLSYAVYQSNQSAATLQLADWDDHHRCDGDHDRDDRHCYWRDRDGDRYYYRGNGYGSNGYYYNQPRYNSYYGSNGYNSYYGQNGWYDNHGRWHSDGWYDKHGKWHKGTPRDDR